MKRPTKKSKRPWKLLASLIGPLLTLMFLTLMSTNAFAQDCETDREISWLCQGDRAWRNGYLLDTQTVRDLLTAEEQLDLMIMKRDTFRDLALKVQNERRQCVERERETLLLLDEAIELQSAYLLQRNQFEDELRVVEADLVDARKNTWQDWEVGLLTGGVGLVAALVGIGVYALVGGP